MVEHRSVEDIYQLLSASNVKRITLEEHKVEDNTNCPDVDTLIILVSHEDFRAKIHRCTAECGPEVCIPVYAPAKVTELDNALNK